MSRLSSAGDPRTLTRVKKEKVDVNYKGKEKARVEDEGDGNDADADGDEDDAEGEEQGDDAEGEVDDERGSYSRAKRTRVNEEGDSRPGGTAKPEHRIKTLPRDTDGYIPGSIVRIRLQNFVTYDFVEFSVGPYLNMILGPNGTGKSSIACAICLGLNFPPNVLGRAADLNSFVKNGYETGYIEIELKGRKGEGNLVIRRKLSATSKQSSFTLNGRDASGKEIQAKMAELNVQVGNLCSFLPQDKVSEFAQMSPQELLRETQRAAGDERLTKWHDTLIHDGKELRALLQTIKEEREQLRNWQERNDGIERDVQRYKERKNIEATIALLEVLIPVERYRELRYAFMETKKRQRKLHEKVKKLKARNEPAHNLLKKLDADHKEHEKTRDEFKKTLVAKFNKMKNKWSASEKLEQEAEDLSSKLDRLKKDEKERLRKIKGFEAEIERTKEELAKLSQVKLEKPEDLQAEARQINTERADVIARKENVDDKLRTNIDQKARMNVQLAQAHGELKQLDDVNLRKMQSLYKWDRDCHDAVLWLRKNKDLFKMEVFEPPVLSMTVSDRRFVDAVEACFGSFQLRTFVCQCQEDSDTFNRHVNDNGALGRTVRVATWFRPHQQLPTPPMSPEEMASIGFDGYIIDFIECPQGMRWWLQRELNLHRTAVSLRKVDANRAMHLVARPETGGGGSFITAGIMNNVTRSRYGRKAVGNVTRDVGPARSLANVTVDPMVKQRIDATIAHCQEQIMALDQERMDLDRENAAIMEEDKAFKARIDDVTRRRNAIRDAQNHRVKTESKLQRNENSLASLRSQPSAERERERVKRELVNITKKRIQIAHEYTSLARSAIADQTEATRSGIRYLQTGANKAALQELCNKKDEKYQTALAEFNRVDAEFQAIKTRSRQALDESKAVMQDMDPDLRERYNAVEAARTNYLAAVATAVENGTPRPRAPEGVDARPVEELERDLETQRANLDLNLNTNPGVVEQYEKRKRDIEQLTQTVDSRQTKADRIEQNIRSARERWQPALEKLVASIGEKFSAAFDRIGCAGEIRISENDDYEKWAIDILVKFRDTEKLQLLTGQRQSG
ncbi:hypothetical protein H0H81_009306, partial [Sphagnurus paluster]